MRFHTERTQGAMLFPRPADGQVVQVTPPGLAWLPAEGASGYRVEICDHSGASVYDVSVGSDPVHLPDRVLESGEYRWDVVALDKGGTDGARRGEQSFTIAEEAPELPWVDPDVLLSRVPAGHPRFVYLRRDLTQIRETLGTTRNRSWQACLEAADRALDTPPPEYPAYHLAGDDTQVRLEGTRCYRDLGRIVISAMMDLSLAFLVTEEAKYSDAAKRILLEIARWPTDDEDVTSVSAKWGDWSGLHLNRCVHRAYDWVYPALSDEERAQVFEMCEGRAWQTYRRLAERRNYLTCPGESHNGRLIAYLAEMAVVMAGESDGAGTWLDYSLKALTTFYPHWGGHEGGWAEGVPYGLWYNEFYRPAFETLRKTTGFDLWRRPFFRNVRHFFFYCTAARGEIRPFGDSAEQGGPGTPEGRGYAALLWHHAHRFDDPHVGWWVDQIEAWNGSKGELSLLFEDETPSEPPTDLPGSRAFRGVGWAGLHSDLSKPDEDTFVLYKSSPFGSVSHSHADQNAFAIMKGGKALAIPSGYYGPAYGLAHHAEWTRSTKANNCVLVNGEGQAIREPKATGHISAFEERKGLTYLCGKAAEAYMGKLNRFNRHVLFLRPGLVLMLDDLAAPEDSRFQWMLHAFEQMEVHGEAEHIVSMREGATMDVWLRSPAGLELSQTDRFDTPYNAGIPEAFQEDRPNHWHVTAETRREAAAVRVGAAMGVRGHNERLELQVLEQEGWFGARASGTFGTVEGWVQLEPGAAGPDQYGDAAATGRAVLCGVAMDGATFVL